MAGTDLMPLQKEHDIFDLFLILPAFFDPFYPDLANPLHFDQQFRLLLDHVKGILPELLYDPLCEFRAYAFHQPAP